MATAFTAIVVLNWRVPGAFVVNVMVSSKSASRKFRSSRASTTGGMSKAMPLMDPAGCVVKVRWVAITSISSTPMVSELALTIPLPPVDVIKSPVANDTQIESCSVAVVSTSAETR